jgi:hypothetical protein
MPGQRRLRRTGFAGMRSLPEGWLREGHTRESFLDLQPFNVLEFRVRATTSHCPWSRAGCAQQPDQVEAEGR